LVMPVRMAKIKILVVQVGKCREWCRWASAESGAGGQVQRVVQVGKCREWCRWASAESGAGGQVQRAEETSMDSVWIQIGRCTWMLDLDAVLLAHTASRYSRAHSPRPFGMCILGSTVRQRHLLQASNPELLIVCRR
jgi:hypothetical protein